MKDILSSYRTIEGTKTNQFEEERSVFISNAAHVLSEDEARAFISKISEKYKDANHNCYAYIIRGKVPIKRFSDDGEPQGSAGLPILSAIEKADLSNIVLVVTRYFGGKLLGKGGLVRAYTRASSDIINQFAMTKAPFYIVSLNFSYKLIGIIENFLAEEKIEIIEKTYLEDVGIKVYLEFDRFKDVRDKLINLTSNNIKIKIEDELMRFIA